MNIIGIVGRPLIATHKTVVRGIIQLVEQHDSAKTVKQDNTVRVVQANVQIATLDSIA